MSGILSHEAKVHLPANKYACADISVIRLIVHEAISLEAVSMSEAEVAEGKG